MDPKQQMLDNFMLRRNIRRQFLKVEASLSDHWADFFASYEKSLIMLWD